MTISTFWQNQSFWHYYILNGTAKTVGEQLGGYSVFYVRKCKDFN